MPPSTKVTKNYATNQFYNFSKYEDGRAPNQYGNTDNPRFLWPTPTNTNANTNNTFTLQRGYMRMITEGYADAALGSKLKHKRFHFQFNPDVLVRSVTARNDVQFWMNQDPGQLVSPIPGDANFAFEFILNREAEMATGRTRGGFESTAPQGKGNTPVDPTTDPALPLASRTPDVIGVLADLQVFDSIIGQGINSDLFDSITSQYNKNVAASAAATSEANGDKTEDDEDFVTPVEADLDALTKTLKLSLGNSAFLISQPVRILFSSLFMVEGFISSTTVTFNKFNLAMVPTQCTVSVNMQAMYLGFAEKDTFLTSVLRDALTAADEEETEEEAGQLLLKDIKPFLYNPRPLGTLDNDEVGPDRWLVNKVTDPANLQWAVTRTEECKSAMDDGYITGFSANCTIYIYYDGHDSGTGEGYYETHKDEVVHTVSDTVTYGEFDKGFWFNPRNAPKQTGDANMGFSWNLARAIPDIAKAWDKRDGANYRIQIAIEVTIESSYTSVVSDQWWVMDEVRNFDSDWNTWRFKDVIGKPDWHKV